jgi:hypothetical protein
MWRDHARNVHQKRLVFGEAFLIGKASLAGLVDFLITDPIKAEAPVPV